MDDIRLIATDMDHTLLTEKGELPPHIEDYILKLDELGITFTIASGRPLYTLEALFLKYRDKMSFIADNGAIIRYEEEIIYNSLMTQEAYHEMISFTEGQEDGIAIVCGLNSAYVSKKYACHEEHLRIFYSNLTFVDRLDELTVDADKFTIYYPNGNAKEYFDRIFEEKYSKDFSITLGDVTWIDIMNNGVHKGRAIEILAKRLKLDTSRVMVFGDGYNDIEMLQAVKHSYAMDNAVEEVKQHANFIAPPNDEYGVLKVIDKVIQNRM